MEVVEGVPLIVGTRERDAEGKSIGENWSGGLDVCVVICAKF